jgi:hypothetical protein
VETLTFLFADIEGSTVLLERLGDDLYAQLAQANLGDVLRADSDLDGARSAFETALRIGRRNGGNWHMAYAVRPGPALSLETALDLAVGKAGPA